MTFTTRLEAFNTLYILFTFIIVVIIAIAKATYTSVLSNTLPVDSGSMGGVSVVGNGGVVGGCGVVGGSRSVVGCDVTSEPNMEMLPSSCRMACCLVTLTPRPHLGLMSGGASGFCCFFRLCLTGGDRHNCTCTPAAAHADSFSVVVRVCSAASVVAAEAAFGASAAGLAVAVVKVASTT